MNRLKTSTIQSILLASLISVLAACKSHDAINFEANTKDELIYSASKIANIIKKTFFKGKIVSSNGKN